MNKIKMVGFIFLFTLILSIANVKADSYLGLVGVTIPRLHGVYTSPSVEKTTISNQYVKKIGAVDNLSGDDRAMGARLKNVTTYYASLVTGQYTQLFNDNAGLGQTTGNYQLQLRATKSTVSTVSFSGTWILDDYLIN